MYDSYDAAASEDSDAHDDFDEVVAADPLEGVLVNEDARVEDAVAENPNLLDREGVAANSTVTRMLLTRFLPDALLLCLDGHEDPRMSAIIQDVASWRKLE